MEDLTVQLKTAVATTETEALKKPPKASAKSQATKTKKKATPGNKATQQEAPRRQLASYSFSAMEVERPCRFNNKRLSFQISRHWEQLDFALHYVSVFAMEELRDKTVKMTNDALSAHIDKQIVEVENKLGRVRAVAEDADITNGTAKKPNEFVVKITSKLANRVLKFVRLCDDYLAVVDSLWIQEVLPDDARLEAHDEIQGAINGIHRLAVRMKDRLVDYRKGRMDSIQQDQAGSALNEMVTAMTNADGSNGSGIEVLSDQDDKGKVPEQDLKAA